MISFCRSSERSARTPLRLLGFLFLYLAAITSTTATPAFTLDLSGLGGSQTVVGTTIAGGLNYPYGLALATNGSLLFGSSTPNTAGGVEAGPSSASVWILPAQAGGTFGAAQEVVSGLDGPVTSVRSTPNGLTVVDSGAASGREVTFYNQNFQQIGVLNFSYPNPLWEHSTGVSLAVQQPDGSVRVYFLVGSEGDQAKTTNQVTTSGLFSATLNGDSVYMVTVQSNGTSLQVTGPLQQVATGLRNPFGLTLDSAGNLIIGDNGQDGAHPVNETGADSLHSIPAANIGNVLYDFGFPDSYVNLATGTYVNGDPGATPPLVAFLPVSDSNGVLQYSEGLSAMAFVPAGSFWFAGALGGEIVSFHGVMNAAGAANYDNALLYYDFASGVYTPILDAGTAGVGHIDSVLVSGNHLFLGDFAANGLVTQSAGQGTGSIVEFTISPEPSSGTLAVLGLTTMMSIAALRAGRGRSTR
jgi:glucose/arabinose dehydrogenase